MLPDRWYYAKRLAFCCVIAVSVVVVVCLVYNNKQSLDSKYATKLNITKKETLAKKIRNYPFMAFLYITHNNGSDNCGGTLIDSRHILTAAHCIESATNIYILLGTDNLMKEGPSVITLESENFLIHENYNKITYDNDIGIIFLNNDVIVNDDVNIVTWLTQNYFSVTENNIVIGWAASDPSQGLTDELLTKNIVIVDNYHCFNLNDKYYFTKICAYGTPALCHGDSGGPLLSGNVQIGIVSGGDLNCDNSKPSVFTDVRYYKQWILSKLGQKLFININ